MWSIPRPRQNDEGGRYGTGIIGRNYTRGELVTTTVRLTASHLGYFEFRLCPKSSSTELVTQECLDQYLLELDDGTTRYQIKDWAVGDFNPVIRLPSTVTCDYCVIQWLYVTGIVYKSMFVSFIVQQMVFMSFCHKFRHLSGSTRNIRKLRGHCNF